MAFGDSSLRDLLFVNPLTYRSDHHETSPYNPNIIQQMGNEEIQTYQLGFILILHQILITNFQGNI